MKDLVWESGRDGSGNKSWSCFKQVLLGVFLHNAYLNAKCIVVHSIFGLWGFQETFIQK